MSVLTLFVQLCYQTLSDVPHDQLPMPLSTPMKPLSKATPSLTALDICTSINRSSTFFIHSWFYFEKHPPCMEEVEYNSNLVFFLHSLAWVDWLVRSERILLLFRLSFSLSSSEKSFPSPLVKPYDVWCRWKSCRLCSIELKIEPGKPWIAGSAAKARFVGMEDWLLRSLY